MSAGPAIVADIGGTNVRFAIHDRGQISRRWNVAGDALSGLAEGVEGYLRQLKADRPRRIVLAIAGPIDGDRAVMTNRDWSLTTGRVQAMGFDEVLLVNDFAALAWSLPHLTGAQIQVIGARLRFGEGPCVVVGPGTGLGVSVSAAPRSGGPVLQTQGGHVGFAPQDDVETAVFTDLRQSLGRVSAEHLLSGPGLVRLYGALARQSGADPVAQEPAQIVARGHDDGLCRATIDRFLDILASFCGDAAMAYGARGGVYIGGGLALRLAPYLDADRFRTRFESKGHMAFYNQPIPTMLIADPDAALYGAAAALEAAFS